MGYSHYFSGSISVYPKKIPINFLKKIPKYLCFNIIKTNERVIINSGDYIYTMDNKIYCIQQRGMGPNIDNLTKLTTYLYKKGYRFKGDIIYCSESGEGGNIYISDDGTAICKYNNNDDNNCICKYNKEHEYYKDKSNKIYYVLSETINNNEDIITYKQIYPLKSELYIERKEEFLNKYKIIKNKELDNEIKLLKNEQNYEYDEYDNYNNSKYDNKLNTFITKLLNKLNKLNNILNILFNKHKDEEKKRNIIYHRVSNKLNIDEEYINIYIKINTLINEDDKKTDIEYDEKLYILINRENNDNNKYDDGDRYDDDDKYDNKYDNKLKILNNKLNISIYETNIYKENLYEKNNNEDNDYDKKEMKDKNNNIYILN